MIPNHIEQTLESFEKITSFVRDVNSLPYYGGDKLEKAVEELFLRNGIQDGNQLFADRFKKPNVRTVKQGGELCAHVRRELRRGNFKILADTIPQLKDGLWYINQPMGNGVAYPDHILVMYGRVVYIEDKSAQKRAGIRYNNTLPHPKTFYILSDKSHNRTMFLQANRMDMSLEEYDFVSGWLDEMFDTLKALRDVKVEEYKKMFGKYPYYEPYMRPQIDHVGSVDQRDFIRRAEANDWIEEPLNELLRQLKKGISQYLSTK